MNHVGWIVKNLSAREMNSRMTKGRKKCRGKVHIGGDKSFKQAEKSSISNDELIRRKFRIRARGAF